MVGKEINMNRTNTLLSILALAAAATITNAQMVTGFTATASFSARQETFRFKATPYSVMNDTLLTGTNSAGISTYSLNTATANRLATNCASVNIQQSETSLPTCFGYSETDALNAQYTAATRWLDTAAADYNETITFTLPAESFLYFHSTASKGCTITIGLTDPNGNPLAMDEGYEELPAGTYTLAVSGASSVSAPTFTGPIQSSQTLAWDFAIFPLNIVRG